MSAVQLKTKQEIEILDYTDDLRELFERINTQWMHEFFSGDLSVENIDREIFKNPEEKILKNGGAIFFAKYKNKIVGTCALFKKSEREYYLGKMAVLKEYRKKGNGSALLRHAIETVKNKHGSFITLETNTILQDAINLYKKFGFYFVPVGKSKYKKVNSKMKLDL